MLKMEFARTGPRVRAGRRCGEGASGRQGLAPKIGRAVARLSNRCVSGSGGVAGRVRPAGVSMACSASTRFSGPEPGGSGEVRL